VKFEQQNRGNKMSETVKIIAVVFILASILFLGIEIGSHMYQTNEKIKGQSVEVETENIILVSN
jgi:hypothetical protein